MHPLNEKDRCGCPGEGQSSGLRFFLLFQQGGAEIPQSSDCGAHLFYQIFAQMSASFEKARFFNFSSESSAIEQKNPVLSYRIFCVASFINTMWSEWRDLNSLNPFYTVHGHPGMYCFQWFQRFFRTSLYHVKPTEITPLREKIRETFYSHADARFLKHIQKAKLKRQNDR